jgi:2-haloacid dehalogenase
MFDQYGTVVDMQSGLWEVAVDFLKAKGWKGNPYAFVTWWRRTHFESSMIDALLQREHTSYREIRGGWPNSDRAISGGSA